MKSTHKKTNNTMTASHQYRYQEITLTVSPIVAGCVSFISSSTISTMILRSNTKLTKPYRRIVFGMCLYDIVLSLSAMCSSFLSPKESGRVWAFGNDTTCATQGFIQQVGFGGYQYALAHLYLQSNVHFFLLKNFCS